MFRKNMINHNARKKLANQKYNKSTDSVYPCGISEQAFGSHFADGLYRGFNYTSGCNAGCIVSVFVVFCLSVCLFQVCFFIRYARTDVAIYAYSKLAITRHQFSSFALCSPGWEHAFLKQTWQAVDSLNTPYDYSSIMHYKLNAFSRSSRRKTIVPRENVKARPYRRISKIDALQVKRMYNCYGMAFLAFLS